MKKSTIITLISISLCLIIFVFSNGTKSSYDTLRDDQKKIVDNVVSHLYIVRDCNTLRLSKYNGDIYLVASSAKANNKSGFEKAYLVDSSSIKYYIVTENSFRQVDTDAYSSTTIYGTSFRYDSSMSNDQKKEMIAKIVKNL